MGLNLFKSSRSRSVKSSCPTGWSLLPSMTLGHSSRSPPPQWNSSKTTPVLLNSKQLRHSMWSWVKKIQRMKAFVLNLLHHQLTNLVSFFLHHLHLQSSPSVRSLLLLLPQSQQSQLFSQFSFSLPISPTTPRRLHHLKSSSLSVTTS